MELDKRNKQKEASPREGTRIRALFSCTLRHPVRTLNENPLCVCVTHMHTHTEQLMLTSAGPVHATSVFVSSDDLRSCGFRETCSLGVYHPLWLLPYTLSASSSLMFPELWGEGFHGDIPFRASNFSHPMTVVLCICSHLLQGEASHKMAKHGIQKNGQTSILSSTLSLTT